MGKRKLLTQLTYDELKKLDELCNDVNPSYSACIMNSSDGSSVFVILYFDEKYDVVAYGKNYDEIKGQFDAYLRGKDSGK